MRSGRPGRSLQLRPSWPPRGTPAAAACFRRWSIPRPPPCRHWWRSGSSNMVSISDCSRIERRPRAPVLRASALRAMALSAAGRISRSTPSICSSLVNCLTTAFFGSVRICTSASSLSSASEATTGMRPTSSGIRPNLIRSSGSTSRNTSVRLRCFLLLTEAPKPMPEASVRFSITFSRPGERAAADEQDVGRVDLQEILVRVLAPALRRHAGHGAFDQLEQRLLHALARHVAGDRGVVGLARDLVDLVDVDDAALGALDFVVAALQQLLDDVLDVLAHVAGFGQRGGIGHHEGHVEHARQRLGQQRLARAGGADQQDVALG